ncbi:MAG TPA: hypothetical protein VD902_07985 [Symbiobacteriaceae bacterium]|nr:hypothetical protein [Symbiobacteriaceae bacterium]
MPPTQRLALATFVMGAILGLLVLGAAAVTGNKFRTRYWLGGTLWGILSIGLVLSDCLNPATGHGPANGLAVPLFFAGTLGFPAALVWRQQGWVRRWLFAQLIMLVGVVPGFIALVAAALCAFT